MQPSALARWKILLFVGLAILVVAASVAVVLTRVIPHTQSAVPPRATSHDTIMFGFDAQHTHYNPSEQRLTCANVSHLTFDWASPATGGSIFSSPAVADGMVYVGALDHKLYAFHLSGSV